MRADLAFSEGILKKMKNIGILVLIVAIILTVVSSCTTPQYRTYTLQHNDISFSFEYPSAYKKVSAYLQDSQGAPITVRFARLGGIFGLFTTDPHFIVDISSPLSETEVDPKTAADTAGSHTPDQQLERAVITIAGTTGELVAYSQPDTKIVPIIIREVFFNANGVLWNIGIYSSTDKADTAKVDFEHIISTFKVLP
jgi:hypothetical protein